MSADQKKPKLKRRRSFRPSISVCGPVYDRLRAACPDGSLAALVDKLVASTLDDPAQASRVVSQCRQADGLS